MRWQSASGYNMRARAKATTNRWKKVIGDELGVHTDEHRATDVAVAVLTLTACWTWDTQAMSASPEPKCGQS